MTLNRIRFERISRQLPQARVATAARIPQQVISLIESGRLKPSPRQLSRLAEVFNVAPDDLLRDVEPPR